MNKNVEKIKKKMRLTIYNMRRKQYIKKSICKIGKIVEESDKIICYVDKKTLDKYTRRQKNPNLIHLTLNGMNQETNGIKEITKKLKLNKPVYYIFDSINICSGIQFNSRWATVIFKNCTLDKYIDIVWGDKIIFENNIYQDSYPTYFGNDCFLTANRVNKLTFINDKFYNSCENHHPTKFSMKVNANIVEFINTNVNAESPIVIESSKIKIENSIICADEIYIDSKNVEESNGSLLAKNGIMIENKNCDFRGHIKSPKIFYNGIDLTKEINGVENPLQKTRKKLIEKLKDLNKYYQTLKNDRVGEFKHNIDNKPIIKTLKKDDPKH